jgi:uncharacterized protein YunC (DUF1805 family)
MVDLGKAPLVLLKAPKGFVMCGYLNITAVDKVGEAGCRVTGVKSYEDVLNAKLVEVSKAAAAMGCTIGMTGREAIKKMA